METRWQRLDPERPEADILAAAGDVLRQGGLVAFPTETVYGLGANALDASAVGRIYAAKGRPAQNPIIVHVADLAQMARVAISVPAIVETLAAQFWPGPLTLVLPKHPLVPDIVTAGGPTIAVRVPNHPVALGLLQAAGVPVAAPSANRSQQLSPTRAEHVWQDLRGRIDLLLDGGPTPGGIESTVLDLTTNPPRLLRPGLLTGSELEAVVGPVQRSVLVEEAQALPSPGMLKKHYSPRTPLALSTSSDGGWSQVQRLCQKGGRVGWLSFGPAPRTIAESPAGLHPVPMPDTPTAYAARLYAVLHDLDKLGLTCIVVEMPPAREDWLAVRDRLQRAASEATE